MSVKDRKTSVHSLYSSLQKSYDSLSEEQTQPSSNLIQNGADQVLAKTDEDSSFFVPRKK